MKNQKVWQIIQGVNLHCTTSGRILDVTVTVRIIPCQNSDEFGNVIGSFFGKKRSVSLIFTISEYGIVVANVYQTGMIFKKPRA